MHLFLNLWFNALTFGKRERAWFDTARELAFVCMNIPRSNFTLTRPYCLRTANSVPKRLLFFSIFRFQIFLFSFVNPTLSQIKVLSSTLMLSTVMHSTVMLSTVMFSTLMLVFWGPLDHPFLIAKFMTSAWFCKKIIFIPHAKSKRIGRDLTQRSIMKKQQKTTFDWSLGVKLKLYQQIISAPRQIKLS